MFTRSNEANPEYWYFPLIGSLGTNECGLLPLLVTALLDVGTNLQFGSGYSDDVTIKTIHGQLFKPSNQSACMKTLHHHIHTTVQMILNMNGIRFISD